MLTDALAGKIDLIVTKSVIRFARNTVDSLSTIRRLKESGCEVYFEKENIWTFDSKGELLITIMSSLAQEGAVAMIQVATAPFNFACLKAFDFKGFFAYGGSNIQKFCISCGKPFNLGVRL